MGSDLFKRCTKLFEQLKSKGRVSEGERFNPGGASTASYHARPLKGRDFTFEGPSLTFGRAVFTLWPEGITGPVRLKHSGVDERDRVQRKHAEVAIAQFLKANGV